MCVENECVLELHSNPLFTPVPVMNGRVPLKGCVLSVSQFTGAEKKSVEELAMFLGAVYVNIKDSVLSFCLNTQKLYIIDLFLMSSVQNYFVRVANKKNGMLPNTHLVLQSPEGTKYQAAKKWGLPAVSMGWVLECAQTGQKAEEKRYLIDLPPSPGEKFLFANFYFANIFTLLIML